jgi:large subunit ribosomal protein L21
MYAIIESGGKQYKIEKGDIIEVELLKGDKKVQFKKVLLLNDGSKIEVGSPYLEDKVVEGEILEEVKGKKGIAFKYKRRKNYHKTVGFRQRYSKVKITEIK